MHEFEMIGFTVKLSKPVFTLRHVHDIIQFCNSEDSSFRMEPAPRLHGLLQWLKDSDCRGSLPCEYITLIIREMDTPFLIDNKSLLDYDDSNLLNSRFNGLLNVRVRETLEFTDVNGYRDAQKIVDKVAAVARSFIFLGNEITDTLGFEDINTPVLSICGEESPTGSISNSDSD